MSPRRNAGQQSSDPVDRYLAERGVSSVVRKKGLGGLIDDWTSIARSAERYNLTLDDWLNDLDLRDIIAGAIDAASPAEGRTFGAALQRADDAFRAATVESPRSLWGDSRDS